MIHTRSEQKLTAEQIYVFLKEVDRDFPINLSEKTDLIDFANKLHENATICFEMKENRIIGCLAGYTENTINNIGYITVLAVSSEFRGCGYAKKFVKEFIEEAKKRKLIAVHLYAVRTNTSAMHLYQDIGFEEVYFEKDKRKDDVHFIYYIKKTALVTAIGSFSADVVIKTLKRMQFYTIGCDIYPKEWIADSLSVDEFYQVPYVSDENAYYRYVMKLCEEKHVTHVFPSTDIEVDFFEKYRSDFEDKMIRILISDQRAIGICRDKKIQQEYIAKYLPDVATIPTCLVSEVDECPYTYPLICKPVNGRSSQGIRYIWTHDEWAALKQLPKLDDYIVQPVIQGDIYTVDIVRQRDGEKCVAIPRVELLRTPNGAGTSVRVFRDEELQNLCREIADLFEVTGCVNMEFIHAENGKNYYIECNPRFSGGVEFSCIAGYDCVENHIRCFNNSEIEDCNLIREIFIARKYEEYITGTCNTEKL